MLNRTDFCHFLCNLKKFHCCQWWTHNLAIWSHWSRATRKRHFLFSFYFVYFFTFIFAGAVVQRVFQGEREGAVKRWLQEVEGKEADGRGSGRVHGVVGTGWRPWTQWIRWQRWPSCRRGCGQQPQSWCGQGQRGPCCDGAPEKHHVSPATGSGR